MKIILLKKLPVEKLFLLATMLLVVATACKKKEEDPDSPPKQLPVIPVNLLIPADSVKLNPSGYAPLSALVSFNSTVVGKTVIIVKGKHGPTGNIEHVFNDRGLTHSVQVIGLYANYLNSIDIRLINTYGDTVAKTTLRIQTGILPPGVPASIQADIFPGDKAEKGLNLVSNYSAVLPHMPLLVDNNGDIRWLLDYSTHPYLHDLVYENGIKRLRNGNFYFGNANTNTFHEVDLFGQVLHSLDLNPMGYIFHHDTYEKPDGNLIVAVSKPGSTKLDGKPTYNDYIIELDWQSATIKNVWDLKVPLDEYRIAINADPNNWMHVNSVIYDSTDNTIIVSGRHQGVAKITYDNKLKWIIANHKGWGVNRKGQDMNQFLLTPLDAAGRAITDTAVLNGSGNHPDFEWCWYQHSTATLPNGNYMLFDNGTTRNYDNAAPKYSRVVEYKIDPVKMTIQQVWQYGKERGLETYSSIVSSVQFLPATNHVLFCPGYQVINYDGLGGKVIEVDYKTKQVIGQLSFSALNKWGFHRTIRISAYP